MRLAPFAFLALACGGCAIFQPVPTQSLACIEAQAPNFIADAAVAAGNAIAGHETSADIDAAAAPLAADFIACEALAIEGDVTHAANVAATASVSVATVQAHAVTYLQAKGIAVVRK